MRIAVVGVGYVGLVSGVCFSEMGNNVTCVDVDEEKINKLNKGLLPIYEPGLKELVQNNLDKNLFFTTNVKKAINNSDIIFIAVGTPMNKDGTANLSAIYQVAEILGKSINEYKIIVSKSTVPVGTTFKVKKIVEEEIKKRKVSVPFDIVSNPEFLKEGAAVNDFMKPDRVVIGAEDNDVFDKMKQLYSPFFRTHDRFITMDVSSAEMTKYAANAMLATKISFINEIANICEKVGADVNKVRVGIGSDSRIGYNFIYPGIGYGGTCFPKDISALIQIGIENGYNPSLISSVNEVNKNQKKYFLNKIINKFGEDLTGFSFAVWGLSFKPETNDMRDAPSLYIISELIKRGAKIKAYDPKAMQEAKNFHLKELDVFYGEEKYEAVKGVDALILLTEWKEFRAPNFDLLKKELKQAVIFDARNQYNSFNLENEGFEYYQIGKS
ncbi:MULTISPECIES: UDP-glucose dehydrogenase family protein [Tenacibaculum]|uniref:UDP-glucose dehydrogenase family protein n=1 Tax=Tenacibaculum TaxID=104267 RepID=UPI001F0A5802|nr:MULTISPECIES: UDP-glucose/GDP-mannose dehydrogenase family protein [Tenacibaculum]MCH3883121.1 UDP-glucose/GDP-mannose dehydrogenase family protein [Tenacibaculum aquimarinum]MDO6600858.1 UDP-glucose/GDP-mannose dehydrogenase family protein [Tenacibaculum sp. 1_MG-2023]